MSSTVSGEPTSDIQSAAQRRTKLIVPLILAAVLLVFAPIARHAFIAWDDDYTLQQNPRMTHPSLDNMLHYWRHGFMDLYIPITYTVWTGVAFVSKAIHGSSSELDPRLFHVASILVHAANALLVFTLLRRLLSPAPTRRRAPALPPLPPGEGWGEGELRKTSVEPATSTSTSPHPNPLPEGEGANAGDLAIQWSAAAGALLFALHPVQVETVAWTSGLKDLLCGLFTLLALNQYVQAIESNTRRPRLHYSIALLAMLLGMLSKPTAMITPLLLTIIDLLILRRPFRTVLKSIAPFFLLAIPCLIWTKIQQPDNFLRHIPLWQRPLIAADALGFYLCKLLAPIHLAYDYGRAPWTIFEHRWVWITWTIPAAVAIALIVNRRRALPLCGAALLLVAGVAPVLGLTTFDFEMVSTVADHYLYLALLGPAFAAAWAFTRLPMTERWPKLAVCALVALLAARSADQARYWQDSRAFFTHAVELNPNSWSSWYGLAYVNHMEGRALATAATANKDANDSIEQRLAADNLLNEAMNDYRRCVFLNPADVAAHHGYASMLMYFGMHREAGREFLEVVRRRDLLNPRIRPTYYADTDLLGQCFLNQNRPEEAVKAFQAAMRLHPFPPEAAAHLKQAQRALSARNAPYGPMPLAPAITDIHKEESPLPN